MRFWFLRSPVRLALLFVLLLSVIAFIVVVKGKSRRGHEIRSTSTLEKHDARLQDVQDVKHILAQFEQTIDAESVPYLSRKRATLYQARLLSASNADDRMNWQSKLAIEWLNSGENEKALKAFIELEKLAKKHTPAALPVLKNNLRIHKALAYLRLGEQQNCLNRHNADSCLMPLRGGGIHQLPYGSRQAAIILRDMLRDASDDLEARWLLNVACMTIGDYPHKVPERWLIPPSVFRSDYDIKRFRNIAGNVGLDVGGLAGGVIMEDFDNDNHLDLMCSSMGLKDQLQFFHNNGNGTFTEKTKEAGLIGEVGGLNLTYADYNNDGYSDVLVLRGGWFGKGGLQPNSLLRNNGNGTFTNVTVETGLLSFHPTQTATWFDYNNDGWIDLFIGNESTLFPGSATMYEQIHPCELYRNNQDGTFTECAQENGVAFVGFVKGVTSGDYNNDGRTDLYISCRSEPNILYRNDGPMPSNELAQPHWRFTNVAYSAGVTEPKYSFPTFFFDYDNDGWLDLFVSGYRIEGVADIAADYLKKPTNGVRAKMYHNNRNGTFTDVTSSVRLNHVLQSMGCGYGDLDNDGFLDFYLGTGDPEFTTLVPNRMFRNAKGRFFQDVTTSGGFGHLQKGHGIAFGDIDNDGDQDIYEDMGGARDGDIAYNTLYENPGHGNQWLMLKLEGVESNRAAIGARVKVIVRMTSGLRTIYRTISTGTSFGNLPSRQEIGLGKAQRIETIEVFWPVTGKTQVFNKLLLNRCYKIREESAEIAAVPLKTIHLQSNNAQHDQHSHLNH